MNIIQRTGWIVLGIAIGVIGTSRIGAVTEQAAFPKSDGARLTIALADTPIGRFAFVKDTKSEGCWIVRSSGEGVAMAPAPNPACQ
jgi:hypothetical protein